MAKFRVKSGHHAIGGKFYKSGDVVEVDNEKFATGDNAAFFEKIAEQSAAAAETGEDGKGKGKGRGKGKGKPEAGEGSEPAAEAGEGKPSNPEA